MEALTPIASNLLQELIDRVDLVIIQPPQIQLNLAQDLHTPRSILQVLVDRAEPDIAAVAKLHVNYAGELTTDGREEIDAIFHTAQLGQNDRLAVELLKLGTVPPEFLSAWVPANHLLEALKSPHLPLRDRIKFLARLAQDDSLEPRLQVAESLDTPPSLLAQLLGDAVLAVRIATRHHPHCPTDAIELIDSQIEIASNWDTQPEILASLARSDWDWVRLTVAQNPSANAEILSELARDRVYKVRLAVAKNLHTSADILEILLANKQDDIQAAIAYHPHATAEILLQLFPNQEMVILKRSDLPSEFLQKLLNRILEPKSINDLSYTIVKQKYASANVLAKLIKCDSSKGENYLFADIARHPNVSAKVLTLLSESNNSTILLAVAKNSRTPDNIKKHLIKKSLKKEHHLEICIALIGNQTTNIDFRESLIDRVKSQSAKIGNSNANISILAALANNRSIPVEDRNKYMQELMNDPAGIVYLSTDPQTPVEILERILDLNMEDRQIQEKLVRNPAMPEHLLKLMASERYRHAHASDLTRHPNAPIDFLRLYPTAEFKNHNNENYRTEIVMEHPKMRFSLDGYRWRLELDANRELSETNQILVRRADSPYALAQVLTTGDRNAKIAAARNPKTPIEVLKQLAQDEDETVLYVLIDCQHLPLSVRLLMTGDSNVNVRSSLAHKHPYRTTPVEILERLATDESPDVRSQVAANSDTPIAILNELAGDDDRSVKVSLVSNPNTPVEILLRLGMEEDIFNGRNPNTPGVVLDRAVRLIQAGTVYDYHDREPLANFIKHPVKGSQMPAETLARLANSSTNLSVRYRVAQHPNTTSETLERLAGDYYIATTRAIAENPRTPARILARLANHPDFTTCFNVVRNPNTRVSTLTRIVQSQIVSGNAPHVTVDSLKTALPGDRYQILQSIAHQSRTPLEALEILARRQFAIQPGDPNSFFPPTTADEIVQAVANNSNLTPELLDVLSHDPCVEVRVAICHHAHLTAELSRKLANDESAEVRGTIARNPLTPADILDLLTTDRDVEVRLQLAMNNDAPADILTKLAADSDLNVRSQIALNPNTPIDALDRLADDDKIEVRRAVLNNSNTPANIKDKLRDLLPRGTSAAISPTLRSLPRIYNPQTDDLPTILSEYVESDNAFVRLVTLRHPLTPIEILERGKRSIEWIDRYAVADNPATPTSICQQLTQDSNRIVRAIANANLEKLDA